MFCQFYKFTRAVKRLLLTFYAVLVNRQTGLLLLLLGGFWLSGTIYCKMFLPDKICWQWSFWHLFDISELRQTLGTAPLHAKIAGCILYVFTWVLGCGVLITILIDEKMRWVRKYNLGLYHSTSHRRNHIVVLGWDEMGCSLVRELLASNPKNDLKFKKIIILSSVSAEEIRKQLLRYGIDTDAIPTAIDPWNGEFDSESDIRTLRLEAAKAVYVLGEPDEAGHDHRVLALLDFLNICLREKRKTPLPCYALINQYALYWSLIREPRSAETQSTLDITPINFHENWCKHIWCTLPEPGNRKYPHLCTDFSCGKDVVLAIAGFSAMGQTMLIEALRVAHFAGQRKTEVLIIDPDADRLLRDFMAAHPNSDTITGFSFLAPINGVISAAAALEKLDQLRTNRQLTVALTYRNTDHALTDALLLKKRLGDDFTLLVRQDSSVSHSLSASAEHLTLYNWGNVFFFGRRCDSAYNPWHREILAKQLHAKYLDTLEKRLKESQRDWEYLDEQYRWKYRYQIDSLPELLHSVGIDIAPVVNEADRKGAASFFWTEREITSLAECSHNRWWADRILEGWTCGDIYDKANRKAPNMRPYNELPETRRNIDFQFIGKIPGCLSEIGYYLKRIERRKLSCIGDGAK